MNDLNLYRIGSETQQLYERVIDTLDSETGEVDLEAVTALEAKKEEFAMVAINYATVIRMLQRKTEEADAEIKRMAAIKDKLGRTVETMTKTLSAACQGLGFDKINGLTAAISFRKSEQTIIDNAEMLPLEFVKEKITYAPDKTAIKNAIKAGQDVPGAHIETLNNIQIK